ncbi:PREDICTED: uncharacterized protein LOC106628233 [Pseudopodoces humilis]|uniref:uncharacterized protein LOC106628233 n=1 Tax=Pseudopodoces humilis TaxID=181119 RepID=UPI0006B80B01|nr:PREDICTED: uncharacterized protein LOC106628233 [Pseudopodoces humilis]
MPHNGVSSSEPPHPCASRCSPGKYGCVFLQIEVGCSSWPCDQPYFTQVPTVTLMPPADSKVDQNCCRVWIFKESEIQGGGAACGSWKGLPGAHLSHSAQMVLLAEWNQELRPRAGKGTLGAHPELPAEDAGGPAVPGCFLLDLLPTHASQCGEHPSAAWPFLSPDTRVSCPICQLPFGMAEVEQHASNCGETAGALSSPQCLQ